MASRIVQMERTNLEGNKSHLSQHEPEDLCGDDENNRNRDDGSDDEEEIDSKFAPDFCKTMWHSKEEKPMDQTKRSEDVSPEGIKYTEAVYEADTTFDILYSNRLKITFPEVKVKKSYLGKVRIAWTNNPAICYCVQYVCTVDNIVSNDFDSGWIDDYMMWGTDRGFNKDRDFSIGNIPQMVDWTETSIRRKVCIFTVPFHYTYERNGAIPMDLLPNGAKVSHTLKFYQDPLKYLLRVEVFDDEEQVWKPLTDRDSIHKFVDCGDFQDPVLVAKYAHLSQLERIERKNMAIQSKIVIPVHSVEVIKNPNKARYGTIDKNFLQTEDPVLAVFWKSLNVEAEKINNRCNYTTDPRDVRRGQCPTDYNALYYEKIRKFLLTSEEMRAVDLTENFPNIPTGTGYGAYANSMNPFSLRGTVGVIYSQNISVRLESSYVRPNSRSEVHQDKNDDDVDPDSLIKMVLNRNNKKSSSIAASSSSSLSSNFDEENEDCSFRTEIRCLISKEFHFSYSDEKDVNDFVVEYL